MSFAYDLALIATIGLSSWIALDLTLDSARRGTLASVAVLALTCAVWSAGELLLSQARSTAEVLVARRILFAGVCTLPAAWLWSARTAARPSSSRWLLLAFLPGALAYSGLYLAPGGSFVDWYARPPRHGPLFIAYAVYSWFLVVVGAASMIRAARRSPSASRFHQRVIAVAAVVPLLANLAYLVFGVTSWDPTPVTLGFSAAVFRFFVIDLTWGAYQPPIARAEMVAQMRQAALVADLAGRVVDWNDAATELLGGDLEGRALRELLDDATKRRGRELEVHEFRLQRRGHTFGTGTIVVDRSEARRIELRAEMATRQEALGYLAGGVAHEINNPLAYVSANLGLLEPLLANLDGEQANEAALLLADVREGTERIGRIVQTLTSAVQAGDPGEVMQPRHLHAAIERAALMACVGRRVRGIPVSVPDSLPAVQAAETDVIHIVLHLLLNALQIGGPNVPISIELRSAGDEVAVRVADRGPGVRSADLPHLFEPFYTTRRPGTHLGLGLSLCWELARRNGGRLEAENLEVGGAAFTLSLRRARAPEDPRPASD